MEVRKRRQTSDEIEAKNERRKNWDEGEKQERRNKRLESDIGEKAMLRDEKRERGEIDEDKTSYRWEKIDEKVLIKKFNL